MNVPPHDLSRLRIDRSAPQRKSRAPLFAVLAALVLAIGYFAWRTFGVATPSVKVVVVTASAGARGDASRGETAVTANGYVVARTRAAVAAKVPGRLAMLSVSEGSHVTKGTVIARLENADFAAAVEEARANVGVSIAQRTEAESDRDQASREFERLKRMNRENSLNTSAQELEISESRATQAAARASSAAARSEAAKASLRFAEASFENTIIRAPFTGTVLRKEAEVGEVVAPSVGGGLTRGAVVTIADLSTLEVEVDVNEAYIGRVTSGQEARITLDAYPDTAFRGAVRQVVPTADRQRATVQVKVAITDHDPRILPEMGARVDFVTRPVRGDSDATAAQAVAATSVFRVPAEAVRVANGKTVVWLVRQGKLEMREVDAAPVSAGFRDIRKGLSGGEQLLLSGVPEPVEGMKVKVETP